MSFASLLAQMKRQNAASVTGSAAVDTTGTADKQGAVRQQHQAAKPAVRQPAPPAKVSRPQHPTAAPNMDPAVARLKAARAAEKEAALKRKLEAKGANKTAKPKKTRPATAATTGTTTGATPQGGRRKPQAQNYYEEEKEEAPAKKRLSYKELMQQAASVDGSKMAISIKSKSTSPEPLVKLKKRDPPSVGKLQSHKLAAPSDGRTKASAVRPQDRKAPPRPPVPDRRPNSYEEQDLSDFVVSEDEAVDYHAEIANLFGRNKRPYYDDYSDDDDDMEATGADILQEESKSSRFARMEEEREAELERQKRLEKMKRFKRV